MIFAASIRRKPLYQPWNEEAFRADHRVYAMTPAQRWMYRTSLQAAFFCSTRPYLPDDDAQLWMLAGCESRKQWESNKDVVRSMFTPVELEGVRLLSQKRLLADWNRLEEKRQMLAENGRRGRKAQLLSSNSPANVKQAPGNCPANGGQEKLREVKGSEVSKENLSSEAVASDGEVSKSTSRRDQSTEGFGDFWSLYPRKEAKQAALKAWRKVKADELPAILAALRVATHTEQWQKDGGQFVPLPASWLNGRRWEDEVTVPKQAPGSMPQRRGESLKGEDARPYLEPLPPLPCN